MSDDLLKTLLLPFDTGMLSWPDNRPVLFLRARPVPGLDIAQKARLTAVQTFKPDADILLRQGFAVHAHTPDGLQPAMVLILLPRQRDEAKALMAHAFSIVAPDGHVVAVALNTEGARGHEGDFAALAGTLETLSKHKARVFWANAGQVDPNLVMEWQTLDAPRPIAEGRFLSRPGLFSWDRIDPGSALLAENLPETLSGHGADLGAGFGYLSAAVLAHCPRVKALDLYEAESRALDLARQNLAGAAVALNYHWHDVTTGLAASYDFIVTNPPFHQGRADRIDLGLSFIAAAAGALKPGGRLLLVANRHLPYEAALNKAFASVTQVADRAGFKVLIAQKAGR